MIVKNYVLSSIEELERLYNSSKSQKKAVYYSKLALLELCGWIEESIDDTIIRYCNRKMKLSSNKDAIKEIVRNNSGFQYNSNIRPLLMRAIGIVNIEKIETKLEKTGKITRLSSMLGNLKSSRNDAAHTFLKGVTRTYNAPSRVKQDFLNIYSILKEIDEEVRKL